MKLALVTLALNLFLAFAAFLFMRAAFQGGYGKGYEDGRRGKPRDPWDWLRLGKGFRWPQGVWALNAIAAIGLFSTASTVDNPLDRVVLIVGAIGNLSAGWSSWQHTEGSTAP
jgi:hypothetical protein